ncbi:MAG: hypothetical protein KF746_17695 [Chitinophagaceae bacterium]|nr:hypothetical protein [Chitinophagaceae bacterium]
MKIAHLLGQYLLQNKTMRLQGLGEFTMENFYDNPFEHEKGKVKIPDNAIKFTPNKKCGEDADLIEFISKHTGKIKPLASSDLEDFLNIGNQLLNVSKQFYIEGLGTMVLDANNNLNFSQGNELVPAAVTEETLSKKKYEIKENVDPVSFTDDGRSGSAGNSTRKFLVTLLVVAALALLGWGVYYFYDQWQSKTNSSIPQDIQPVLPTPVTAPDSTIPKSANDSVNTIGADSAAAPPSYKVIIETSKRARALKRHQDLLDMGYKVNMTTEDSVTFSIFTIINGPLSDTARVRDSIARFFGRKVIIDTSK